MSGVPCMGTTGKPDSTLDLIGNKIAGTCFCVVPVLHLTPFCNTDAEKARVRAALPNCDNLDL